MTWNGHPLYRWMGDHAPGDTTGDGINRFHIAKTSASSAAGRSRSRSDHATDDLPVGLLT